MSLLVLLVDGDAGVWWKLVGMLGYAAAATQSPPPPPRNFHHRNPDFSERTFSFVCGGIERRFSIGFDQRLRPLFFSGSRDANEIDPASIALVTNALRDVTGIGYISPQCNPVRDRITLEVTYSNGMRADLMIDWEGNQLSLVGPFLVSRARTP